MNSKKDFKTQKYNHCDFTRVQETEVLNEHGIMDSSVLTVHVV